MKRYLQFTALLALAAALSSCGGTDTDDPGKTSGLAVPENLSVRELTSSYVTIQWDPVEGAGSYKWKVSEGASEVYSGNVGKRNVSVTELKAGTAYIFSVCAVSASATSPFSSINFTTEGSSEPAAVDGQCIDQPLKLELAGSPVLGSGGLIKVFTDNGSEVDRIDLADLATVSVRENGCFIPKQQIGADSKFNSFMDAIPSAKRYRIEHYTPLRIKGNTLEIKLHSGVLEFGKSYYVTVDESVAGKAVGRGEWNFTVKSKPEGTTLRVNPDGKADFCTVQGALSYASTLAKSEEVTIEVASGTYQEMLFLREKDNVTIKGASRSGTVISYPNNESYCSGNGSSVTSRPGLGAGVGKAGGRGLALVESCDNLRLENITIENSFGEQKGQAETIYFNSSGKLTVESCNLLSWQDTFLTKGQVWVHNSLVAGHVDFIWGYPEVCLFEDCEIRSRAAGYIVQARVNNAADKGFVFLNCTLTEESGVKDGSVYLARSGGDSSKWDNVTYVNCKMSSAIAPAGWFSSPAPNPAAPSADTGWKEFGTTGASTAQRSTQGRLLTAEEAASFSSKQAVLGW